MKSVKKVIRKTLPRYNLRSNPVYHSSTPKIKVNSYVQVDLSQEEISALFEELPFQVSPSDDELPDDSACPGILNYRTVPHPRSSTLGQADVTTREPLDISLNSSSESLVYPSVRETASPTNPPDSLEFDPAGLQSFVYRTPQPAGPARIALQVENISDFEDLEEPREPSEQNQQRPKPSQPSVINSPADLVKLVSRRISDVALESSISEDGFSDSSDETTSESTTTRSSNEQLEAMDRDFLEAHQRLLSTLADRLASRDVRVDKFRGYENEDINRWFEKLELQLSTKNIRTTDPAAISQVVNNLGGPAETFLFELPEDERRDYDHLKQALKRRYSTKDRTWMKRQLLVSRRQESGETLADYINGMHELFSGLNCSEPEKVTYFTEGLQPSIRIKVLERMPETLLEAEELARTFHSISRRVGSSNDNEPIEKALKLLLTPKQAPPAKTPSANPPDWVDTLVEKLSSAPQPTLSAEKKIVSLLEHNNDVLAELRDKLDNSPVSKVPIHTTITRLNGPTAVAALHDTSHASSDNTNRTRSEFQQLKEMIQSLGREMDARIRGLARQGQGTRSEIPRERTRDGRPVCFTCGRVGHLQTSCPERRNVASRVTPQQPQQSPRPNYSLNPNYNQPRDNYRNYSQTNRREQRLAVLDDDLYDEEFVGHLTPSNSEQMNFARRSTPLHRENNVISAIKPSRRQRMVRCPTNLHEKVATQHAVMSPSNRKPQQAKPSATVASEKFPAPNNNQATPEPVTDQGSDASNIPVEFKPAFDLFLRAIKQSQPTTATEDKTLRPQIVNIPNATTAQPIGTEVEDCVDEISSDLDQGSLKTEALQVQDCTPHKEMSQRGDSLAEQVWVSTATRSSPGKVQKRLPHSDASLHSSDLTISGVIAGEAVQLLVDTGACLSVIDEKFLQKIYGSFSPKMTDGILPSIQTVNGERVPVLGKITVPIELNGCEFVCDFHVMQNLAYDAILGRDFLQQNRALIDLDNNNITFKRSKDAKKTRKHSSNLPVLGTFFSPTSVGRQTSTKADLEPHPKMHSPNGVHESQNGNKRVSHYSLLLWVCFVLYLLTASPTVMQESNMPAVQTARKSCVFHDAINENAERGNAGVPVHTIDPLNHNEPYKVTRDNLDAPKSCRVPLKNKQTAVDIFNDSEYAVPDGVRIQKETTLRDLVHESLISVAQDLPKDELKIKPSPTLNL